MDNAITSIHIHAPFVNFTLFALKVNMWLTTLKGTSFWKVAKLNFKYLFYTRALTIILISISNDN